MRLDRFISVSGLAKRRSQAHDALVAGRITRNGRVLKPGHEVKLGDVLLLQYATKFLTVRIKLLPERIVPSNQRSLVYDILDERRDDPLDWLREAADT